MKSQGQNDPWACFCGRCNRHVLHVQVQSGLVCNVVGEPVQTLVQTFSCGSTGALDIPVALAQGVETKLICYLSSIHCIWQILLVSKNEQDSIPQLILIQHPVELIPCLNNTISVVAINNKDKTLCVLEVVPPQWSDL
jgi:hypothetical protein